MEAKKYLKQVEQKQIYYERKQDELKNLKDKETNVTAPLKPDPVQSSSSKDRLGNAIATRIDYETQIVNAAFEDYLNCRNECIKVLEQLKTTSFTQYNILHLHYIEYIPLLEISEKERYSYQYIKELHTAGIKNVQKIINNSNYLLYNTETRLSSEL